MLSGGQYNFRDKHRKARIADSSFTCFSAKLAQEDVSEKEDVAVVLVQYYLQFSHVNLLFLKKKMVIWIMQKPESVIVKEKSVSVILLAGGKGKRMGVSPLGYYYYCCCYWYCHHWHYSVSSSTNDFCE